MRDATTCLSSMSCHQRLLRSRSRTRHASRSVSRRAGRKELPACALQASADVCCTTKAPRRGTRGRTLLLHVHLLDFLPVQDLDGHLVRGEHMLGHLHLRARAVQLAPRSSAKLGVFSHCRAPYIAPGTARGASTPVQAWTRIHPRRKHGLQAAARAARLAEGANAERLAQAVVGQEELGRLAVPAARLLLLLLRRHARAACLAPTRARRSHPGRPAAARRGPTPPHGAPRAPPRAHTSASSARAYQAAPFDLVRSAEGLGQSLATPQESQ